MRTVYRDIRTLEEAGIPLTGEAGVGYSIMNGYRLPPVMLTREEAVALLTADKLVSKLSDQATGNDHSSAMYKIRSVLKNTDKEVLENLDDKIAVFNNPWIPQNFQENNMVSTLTKAVNDKSILKIRYFSNHSLEENERLIEPVGLWFQTGRWQLTAWCRLRKDYRNFRTDRILNCESTGEKYSKSHPKLNEFFEKVAKEQQLITVVIRVKKKAYKHIGDQKYYMGFVSQKNLGDWVEMKFLCNSLEGIARWYMMMGDVSEIVEPMQLKDHVKQLIKKTQDNL